MADYIFVVQLDVPEEHDAEFNRLYDGEHLPNLKSVAGVSSARRYQLKGEGQDMLRYLAIYQIDSPDIPDTDEWKKMGSTEGWMTVRPHISTRRRGVFRSM